MVLEKDEKLLIGVHCTHGVSRTGYVIAAYLASYWKYDIHEAIEIVEQKRGEKIDKDDLI